VECGLTQAIPGLRPAGELKFAQQVPDDGRFRNFPYKRKAPPMGGLLTCAARGRTSVV